MKPTIKMPIIEFRSTVLFVWLGSMIWFWRDFSLAVLPGDNGDTRLTMMWTENWYQSIKQFSNPLNIPQFFPLENSLSGSDAFFLQAIVHSFLRTVGFNISTAFVSAILLLHIIGCLSSLYLCKLLKLPMLASIVLVSLYGTMTPFWQSRNHVQVLIFPMLGWCVYFLVNALIAPYKKRNFVYASLIFWGILLSSGYAIGFFIFFMIICFVVFWLTHDHKDFRKIPDLLLVSKNLLIAQIYSFPLILLFIRIYFSKDSFIGTHSRKEMLHYSPGVFDLIDIPLSSGNLESKLPIFNRIITLINQLPNPTGEFGGAFSLTTIAMFLLIMVYLIWNFNQRHMQGNHLYFKLATLLCISLLVSFIIIMKDSRGINIWSFSFYSLPFFGSIRVLSRFALFASLVLPFIFALTARLFQTQSKFRLKSVFIVLSLLGVFFTQSTNYYGNFQSKDLLETRVISNEIKKECDSFFIITSKSSRNTIPAYIPPVVALQIALDSKVPTINGNSSFLPLGYDQSLLFHSELTLPSLKKWISKSGLSRVCVVMMSGNVETQKLQLAFKMTGR